MNDAIGIRPQANFDFGMILLKDGKERWEYSRCRPVGSTNPKRTIYFFCGTVAITLINLFELSQDRLDVSKKLITFVGKLDSFRVAREKGEV